MRDDRHCGLSRPEPASFMTPREFAEFIALAAIWGASFLFMRVAAPVFGPIPLMLVRCAIGAATLLAVLLYLGKSRDLVAHAGRLAVVGVLNSAIPFVLLGYAALTLTAGITSILNSLAPLWSAVVAFVWLGDRLTRAQVIGLMLGAVGVVVLASGGGGADSGAVAVSEAVGSSSVATVVAEQNDSIFGLSSGVLLAFGAGILATAFYGYAANYARRFLVGVHPLATATGSQLSASLFLLVPGLLLWPDATPQAAAPSNAIWLSAVVLGVVCTGLAYLLFFRLIATVGATRTISVTFVIPLFGVGWGYSFLGERIDLVTVVGGAIIILGTALTTGVLFDSQRLKDESPKEHV